MSDAPAGLGKRGTELWESIMADLEGDVHDLSVVIETCRTLDLCDDLAAAVRDHGPMVKGSRGQLVVNPATQELRLQRALYSRLLAQLNLDEAEMGAMLSARQAAAKRAAQASWRARRAANGAA